MRSPALGRRAAFQLFAAVSPAILTPPQALLASEPPVSSGVRTRSGVQFIDFRVGDGPTPRFGQLVRIHYVGYIPGERSGELESFDSSYERTTPYFTKHGNGYTCQGLEEAVHTMRVGGRRRVILPPALGYTGDKGPVPPSSGGRKRLYQAVAAQQPLIFDIELVSAIDDLVDRGDYDDLDEAEAAAVIQSVQNTQSEPV